MSTLKEWIEKCADGEPVLGVVIGQMGWGDYGSEMVPGYKEQPRNRLLTWEAALPHLSYEFDNGYGAPGCNAIYAWTASRVIAISQYDGATAPFWIPRNPQDCVPEMPGG